MQISTSIDKISPALLKVQDELEAIKKKATNPFFKSKYADLAAIIEHVKPVLNKNGISVLQPHFGNVVETILLHESGQFVGSQTAIVCAKPNDPQALGSAISYARRYGLQSIISLPAEDDDGEKAMDRGAGPKGQVNKGTAIVSDIKKNQDF